MKTSYQTPLAQVERRILNNKVTLWFQNDDGVYVCKVNGKIQKFQLFGKMVEWIESQTGVKYPF